MDVIARLDRGLEGDLWKRIDASLSTAVAAANRARHVFTGGMHHSRRFQGTATHSSTSNRSNRCFSRGSGRGKGVGIHGRGRLCSQRRRESVKTDFSESVLHIFVLGTQ